MLEIFPILPTMDNNPLCQIQVLFTNFLKVCLHFLDHICLLFSEPHPNAGPALPIIQGFSSPLIDMERNLALFLGLFNHTLYKSIPLDHEDIKCSVFTSLDLLSGGLVTEEPLNLNEEKAEVDMTSSALTEDPEDPLGNSGWQKITSFFS